MGFRRIEDCQAWQLARAFKLEVYGILRESPDAQRDFKFKGQLTDAAASGEATIREGFARHRSAQLTQFLSYSRASLAEARGWLQDGVDRGYFTADRIADAITLSARATGAVAAWQRSLAPFLTKGENIQSPSRRKPKRG